jgi:RNA polymerase sigma-70 factor, ECF subfamily
MDAYARHGRALLRKAERMLGNRADAQDLVQALFVDLLKKGEGPKEALDLPYLYRAITNRCLTFLRDETNRARLRDSHDESLRGTTRTRCEDQVIGMDLLLKLSHKLDERALEVLFYRYFADMTQDEIAELLGISRKTVGRKLDDVQKAVAELAGSDAAPNGGT